MALRLSRIVASLGSGIGLLSLVALSAGPFAGCADTDTIPAGGNGGSGGSGGSTETGTRPPEGGEGPGTGGNTSCGDIELCNGVDDDCDDQTDEDCPCVEGDAQPCFSGDPALAGVGACVEGVQTCDINGKWSACEGEQAPSVEECNGVDDDCNGQEDDGFDDLTCGMGVCQNTVPSCAMGQPQQCVPLDPPDPTEDCDGVDDDCDGMIDEGCTCTNGTTQACYTGPEGTENTLPCKEGTQTCSGGQWGPCVGQVVPGMEVCDAVDQDCDGNVNEGTCNVPNAIAACMGGGCSISSCSAGYSNCDSNGQNGCETRHSGSSNTAPGEDLGIWAADSAYGFACASGGTCEGPIVTKTGTRGRFFFIDATEESTCPAYVGMQFELIVPAGVDYDLYLTGNGCQADPAFSSTGGTGVDEVITVWCDDVAGDDDSFYVDIEVRYFSGASCEPWELNVFRRAC